MASKVWVRLMSVKPEQERHAVAIEAKLRRNPDQVGIVALTSTSSSEEEHGLQVLHLHPIVQADEPDEARMAGRDAVLKARALAWPLPYDPEHEGDEALTEDQVVVDPVFHDTYPEPTISL
jgi:hypothetical protein